MPATRSIAVYDRPLRLARLTLEYALRDRRGTALQLLDSAGALVTRACRNA
jgi:hypothetical protein